MSGDTAFSPTDGAMSPNPNLHITIEEGSQNSGHLLEEEGDDLENDCEQLFEIEGDDHENERDSKSDQFFDMESNGHENEGDDANEHLFDIEGHSHENEGDDVDEQLFIIEGNDQEDNKDDQSIIDDQTGESQRKGYPPPTVGMAFDSYDDAYNYYNCYAKEIGFAIRVKSSWTKRNSKEKRGAVLCCNCEGFKTAKEANSRRKETRTGCLAMIRLRLVESNRWRVDEAKLEHNHLFDPERAQNSKSHKRMDAGVKRKVEPTLDVEVRTIKLYRTPAADTVSYGSPSSYNGESNQSDRSRRLKLKDGDAQLIHTFFCRAQLSDPNFFYVMDFTDEGCLRNVFWIDSRSRAAYGYFGDVVLFDTTCLSYNYEIPLVEFVGVNHHGQTVLLGCGLLADETLETYIWLFRAWLTCLSGRPPQTIITNQCKAMQTAIAEVFPRAHHRLCLGNVVQSILENLGALQEYEAFQIALFRAVYDSLKVDDFEMAWEDMIQRFGIRDHEWLRILYEDRERWAPVYSKDTFFAGMSNCQKGESTSSSFNGHMHEKTYLKEFFDIHDAVLEKKRQKEALDDFESKDLSPMLKTRCYYELQISQVYTKDLFRKFQDEVVMMSSCFNIAQVHTNGSIATYMIKEREGDDMLRDVRNFEVMYDKAGTEVRCICSCFNFKGYLCRHALCILKYNGVEGIPFQYVLSRWRKDFKRLYVPDFGSNNVDITNPVQWFDHLYKRAMQVVEEGMISQDHYMVAWQAFKESLNKVRLVADKNV